MSELSDSTEESTNALVLALMKNANTRWFYRVAWAFGTAVLLGIAVAVTVWFLQKPIDRDQNMFNAVLALGAGTVFVGALLIRWLFPMPGISCPQCECDWTGSANSTDWLQWKYCPECGLSLTDLREAARQKLRTERAQ